MRDLLVTGTDTGVGKTIIAGALIRAARARGVRSIGFKPAQTGYVEGERSDAELLAAASGERSPLAEPLLQLAEPLAPAVAAERAGAAIAPDGIEGRLRALRHAGFSVVVEGAGGVMVPLVWNYTVIDLAERFGLEAIIVGRAGLGTLNHLVMTVEMLRARRIEICAVILNGRGDPPDLAEATNPAALARLVPDVTIVEVPRQTAPTAEGLIEAVVPFVRTLVA